MCYEIIFINQTVIFFCTFLHVCNPIIRGMFLNSFFHILENLKHRLLSTFRLHISQPFRRSRTRFHHYSSLIIFVYGYLIDTHKNIFTALENFYYWKNFFHDVEKRLFCADLNDFLGFVYAWEFLRHVFTWILFEELWSVIFFKQENFYDKIITTKSIT